MHDQHEAPGLGHNAPRLRQWHTAPLLPGMTHVHAEELSSEPDLDLVEAAFAEGFATASDPDQLPASGGHPVLAVDGPAGGLPARVELEQRTDIGSLTPTLGGGSFRYDPLPARMVSKRRRLRLAYHDGASPRHLSGRGKGAVGS